MNQLLQQFYNNHGQREAVREFMIECLKEMAVERAFDKQGDCIGIAEAKECIDKMFEELEVQFGKVDKKEVMDAR